MKPTLTLLVEFTATPPAPANNATTRDELAFRLIDEIGAVGVYPNADCLLRDGECFHRQSTIKTDHLAPDERAIVEHLLAARHAIDKHDLIHAAVAIRIGQNRARRIISKLCEQGILHEFSVARHRKRSAVFVALLG